MNICNPRPHTQMECDTKTQNLVIDLQRKTKIRVKDAPSLCLTSQLCFHYLVWSTSIRTGEQGQSLNIRFHQQLAFPSATCSVLLEAGPQSQGQGWGQNLKSPCRSCSLPDLQQHLAVTTQICQRESSKGTTGSVLASEQGHRAP